MAKPRKQYSEVKKRQPPFSQEEVRYIEKHYGAKSPESIAKYIGRPTKSVIQKAWKLGLGKNRPRISPATGTTETTWTPPSPTDLSNPFFRPIPESAKPGRGRIVTFGN